MKDFDIEKLDKQNIYSVPDNLFQNIQNRVLAEANDFDVEKLERKNIYHISDGLFENIQNNVIADVKGFDLEMLERKNIYKVQDYLFENIQSRVLAEIIVKKKTPVFKLSWAYAAAASLALIFGGTFLYNSISDNSSEIAVVEISPKKESQIAYETLQADLTSVESNNQIAENQDVRPLVSTASQNGNTAKNVKTVTASKKQTEKQMNEYLDSFTSSEIADLAVNGNQDVYLDLYN